MKCTKIYKARAQLLFCSLNLLFDGVAVTVAVVELPIVVPTQNLPKSSPTRPTLQDRCKSFTQ